MFESYFVFGMLENLVLYVCLAWDFHKYINSALVTKTNAKDEEEGEAAAALNLEPLVQGGGIITPHPLGDLTEVLKMNFPFWHAGENSRNVWMDSDNMWVHIENT